MSKARPLLQHQRGHCSAPPECEPWSGHWVLWRQGQKWYRFFLESSDDLLPFGQPECRRAQWAPTDQWGQRPEAEKQDGRNLGPWASAAHLPRPRAVTPERSQPLSCLTLRSGVSFRAGRTTLPNAALKKSLHTLTALWGGCVYTIYKH